MLGHIRKNWKWRWFRLQNANLAYFANSMETFPLGMLQLSCYTLRLCPSQLRPYAFMLEPTRSGLSAFHICAMSADSCDGWVIRLRKFTSNGLTNSNSNIKNMSPTSNIRHLNNNNNNDQQPSQHHQGSRPRSVAGSNPPKQVIFSFSPRYVMCSHLKYG
jgi:hypothetical protein